MQFGYQPEADGLSVRLVLRRTAAQQHETTGAPATGRELHFALVATVRAVATATPATGSSCVTPSRISVDDPVVGLGASLADAFVMHPAKRFTLAAFEAGSKHVGKIRAMTETYFVG